jgi:hypothetical protein
MRGIVSGAIIGLFCVTARFGTPQTGSQKVLDNGTQVLNARVYGAVCDGGSHPLSGYYGTLAAAQAVYPFITSLSQQLDYAAAKAAANVAFGPDGSEHGTNTALNVPLLFPAGTCNFGSDELLIRNADGIRIEGAGKTATILEGSGIVLGFDGLWYSELSNFEVSTTGSSATAALDIDGNVPGHPYGTRGVQGNLLENVLVVGGGARTAQYALAWCRQGTNNAQCSENTMVNLHVANAISPFYIIGFNALDNVWIGGDAQSFKGPGVYNYEASLDLIKISFEGGQGCQQITDNTYDIDGSAGGVGGSIRIVGGRTEDYQLFNGNAAAPAVITGVSTNPASFSWAANQVVTLNEGTFQTGADGHNHLYCVTTGGTTGSGSAPTWPASGTVTDGTAVWTTTAYYTANVPAGRFDFSSNHYDPSGLVLASGQFEQGGDIRSNFASGQYTYVVDATDALSEMYVSSQTVSAGVFANSQLTTQTSLKTGVTYPAASAGVNTGLIDTYIGNSHAWMLLSHTNADLEFNLFGAPDVAVINPNGLKLGAGLGYQIDSTTHPTITGCGTVSSQVGGKLAGTFVTSATSCTPVLSVLPATANGYACMLWDQTNPTNPIGNVSSTTTSATFGTITTTASDTLTFQCGLSY